MEQLTLAVALPPEADFTHYLPGPNDEAVAAVADWAAGRGDPFLYLFGASGSGKTHLLQAACREAARRGRRALYLPLDHVGLTPAALEDLEQVDHLGLDAIQTHAGDAAWEQALFGAYNRLRDAGRRLLVAADAPLAELPVALPDLRSRLGWGPAYRLRLLDESDCANLLRQAAERRGLSLTEAAVGFIMRRSPRDPRALLDLLDELDRLSLRHHRRPSVWLLRRLLGPDQPSPPSPDDPPCRASGRD